MKEMESSFPLRTKGMPCPGLSTGLHERSAKKWSERTLLIIKGLENMTCEGKLENTPVLHRRGRSNKKKRV